MITWLESYTVSVRKTMNRKSADNVDKVVAHFLAVATDVARKNPGQISAKWLKKYLRKIVNHSGVEAGQLAWDVMTEAWNWGVNHIERFPKRSSPFDKVSSLPQGKPLKAPLCEEKIKLVLAQAKDQQAIMLLTQLQLGLTEKDLFSLAWRDVDLRNKKINVPCVDMFGAAMKQWRTMNGSLVAAMEWWRKHRQQRGLFIFTYGAHFIPKGRGKEERLKNERLAMEYRIACWNRYMKQICRQAGVQAFTSELIRDKIESIIFIMEGDGALLALYEPPKTIRRPKKPPKHKVNIKPTKRPKSGKAGAARKAKRKTK